MLYEILASVTHNPHYLNKYIRFISNCQEKNRNYSGYTEKHHICPKAEDMFPEFTSFREFSWNCVALTPRQHYIAHLLLYRIYPSVISQARALYLMINVAGTKNNSKLYSKIKLEVTEASRNKVVVNDTSGNRLQVSKNDHRYLSGDLVSIAKGKVTVKTITGDTLQVDTDDPRYLSGELQYIHKGKVTVKNTKGDTLQVGVTDPRYLSGELQAINKGKIAVRDSENNTFQVSTDDERYLLKELTGITKGKIVVRDTNGNTTQVDRNDPRYLSGELVGTNKNSISEKRILTAEQVREIRLASKNPMSVLTNNYISSRVKKSQRDKVDKIPFEELKYRNGYKLTYKSLLSNYYAEKYEIDRNIIINILEYSSYRELTV